MIAEIHPLEFTAKVLAALCVLGAAFVIYIIWDKKRKSLPISPFLRGMLSLLLAVLCLIVFTALVFVVAYGLDSFDPSSAIAYFLFGVLSAVACFLIIRNNPSSVWYVPLIINAGTIISALVENFWGIPPNGIPMGIPITAGWILTVIASILGVLRGRGKISSSKL